MASISTLQVVGGMAGAIFGFTYAVSGFSDTGRSASLKDNPRVKNLAWLLSGAGGVAVVDWKILTDQKLEPSQRGDIFVAYAFVAMATAAITLALIAAIILFDARSRSHSKLGLRGRGAGLVMSYLTYGYAKYQTELREYESANLVSTLELIGGLADVVCVSLAATERDRQIPPGYPPRWHLIDQLLGAMESTVELLAPQGTKVDVASNFMVVMDLAKLPVGIEPMFHPPGAGADKFLVLQRYRGGRREPICLPVQPNTRKTHLLPGAPSALALREPVLINCSKIVYGKSVPAALRKDISTFFGDAEYASVLSMPMVWNGTDVGVINVESSAPNLIGEAADALEHATKALIPLCFMLAEVVARAEGL